ncbi:MAG: hypothetical protein NTY65_13775 [Planctomycetota bacterium]|nr:hypothetical protein [Planctomycetota bacterium]
MLFTLKHLLLTTGLLGLSAGLLGAVLGDLLREAVPESLGVLLILGCSILTLLGLSWPIYRLIHLRPLGLPFCPHCRKRHGNYHVPANAWPDAILLCVWCGKPTRLCLTRKKPADIGADVPSLYLRWPEFLGLWRPVHASGIQAVTLLEAKPPSRTESGPGAKQT